MNDLIKRLRAAARAELFGDTLFDEAAERIQQLETEIVVLEDIQDNYRLRIEALKKDQENTEL